MPGTETARKRRKRKIGMNLSLRERNAEMRDCITIGSNEKIAPRQRSGKSSRRERVLSDNPYQGNRINRSIARQKFRANTFMHCPKFFLTAVKNKNIHFLKRLIENSLIVRQAQTIQIAGWIEK